MNNGQNDKPTKLPPIGTIARAVLNRLEAAGPAGMRFNDLRTVYCQSSPTWRALNPGSRARQNFFERCGMTLVRILRRYATKQGQPGGRGRWVFTFDPKAGTLADPKVVERIQIDHALTVVRGLPRHGKAEVAEACGQYNAAADEIARLKRLLREHGEQLIRWAKESVDGGWSTHQVGPMREAACKLLQEVV